MKSETFTQIYIHLVFSPKGRQALLTDDIQPRVYGYIGETLNNKKHKTYVVNGMPDHIHILFGLNPAISISDVVRDLKRSSSLFINENNLTIGQFSWQDGYGAFSYGKSQVHNVFNYIQRQKDHHMCKPFRAEYKELLDRFEIPFSGRQLFEFYD
jgi:putative transposase